VIKVGALVFQNTIPADSGQGLPGTNAFWLYWNSMSLLPLTNVWVTVTGTDPAQQPITRTIGASGAFNPTKAVGEPDPQAAFSTAAKITSAVLTGDVANGYAIWADQRYNVKAQSVTATLTNANGLVAFGDPDATGPADTIDVNATPTPRSYYLAEGATVWTFDTQIALANRGQADAPVTLRFLKELSSDCTGSQVVEHSITVPQEARATVRAWDVPGMARCSFSTEVISVEGVPLSVERTMTWDGGHGAHAGTAAEALSTVWYFAEGVQSWMDTYVLIANPTAADANVTVTFLLTTGEPVVGTLVVPAAGRRTIWTGAIPGLQWKSFGMVVTSTQPVVAERSVYFGTERRWDGGTLAMGVTAPSTHWYFGEGALGSGFDEYLLLSNPSADPASVQVDYLPTNGPVVTLTYDVPAQARRTVLVTTEPLGLSMPNGLGMRVTSAVPVLAERAMYLRPDPVNWHDGHASPGSTELGTVWEVADCLVGTVGTATNAETYILLSNPATQDSTVTVTYSREGGKPAIAVDYVVKAGKRLTVYPNGEKGADNVPLLSNERFGAGIVVTNGVPIVVERSVYWDAGGLRWAAATNTLGTKLQ